MKLEKVENGYKIGSRVFLATGDETDTSRISLMSKRGPKMNYGKPTGRIVAFPGEYDLDGVGITCFEAGNMLHYIVKIDKKRIGIVLDKGVFDVGSFDNIDHWFVSNKDIQDEVEMLEHQGEVTILD